eukprot:CFRG7170T1
MFLRLSASKAITLRAALSVQRLRTLSSHAAAEDGISRQNTPFTYESHEVFNQSSLVSDYNAYTSDKALVENIALYGATWAEPHLVTTGQLSGSASVQEESHLANKYGPTLCTHDRNGNRINAVRFHPSYHTLLKNGIERAQSASYAWNHTDKESPHVAGAALTALSNHADVGVGCPLTMTYACAVVLRDHANMKEWYEKAITPVYDSRDVPISEKQGITIGMSMTEKQGGTDVRANTTVATHVSGDEYSLTGHKWFTSAPMCDGFLTLAYTEKSKGLSCFLIPRWKPSGERNIGFKIERLKDKLGDRSNASSEVEYHGAFGTLIGKEGSGVRIIMNMVALTRLNCTIGSSSLMKQSLAYAVNHVAGREVFGKRLIDQPVMMNVLADLSLEADAGTYMAMRTAYAIDRREKGNEDDAKFMRIAVAISKYLVCKAAPRAVVEALECFGGNGYDEEWMMSRMYRQAPLNSIWEGSGNVVCLDVLRTVNKEPESLHLLFTEFQLAKGMDTRYDSFIEHLEKEVRMLNSEIHVRRQVITFCIIVDQLGVALQACLLLRHAPSPVASAFCASRLPTANVIGRHNFGTLDITQSELQYLVDRAIPTHA